ncbi:MAG: DUF6064 family protein [Thermoanaerobaculia bacterium]
MNPPFTADQFLDVFRRYHESVGPAPIALTALGLFIAAAAYRADLRRSWHWAQTAMVLLAAVWLWTGIAYHKAFFVELTPAGSVFGSLFIAEAGLLLISATQNGAWFERASRGSVVVGTLLIAYAFVLYPALGVLLGHRYPYAPTFGTPCPTTVFTFGIFCLLPASIPRFALAIPVLWAVVGSTATVEFGMREDAGLIFAAVAALVVIHHERHHRGLRHVECGNG